MATTKEKKKIMGTYECITKCFCFNKLWNVRDIMQAPVVEGGYNCFKLLSAATEPQEPVKAND